MVAFAGLDEHTTVVVVAVVVVSPAPRISVARTNVAEVALVGVG